MKQIIQTATYRKWEKGIRDKKAKAIIAARVYRLSQGLPGDIKSVGQGVSELKIHYGPGYRVYLKQQGDQIVILLCGGDKSTQSRDIEAAKRLAKEIKL